MKFLILVLLVVGCGSSAHQKAVQKKASDTAKAASARIDATTRAWDAKYNPKKPVSPAACTTTVGFSLSGMVYSSKALTWGDAVNQAPEGKRIVTRGELAMLYDTGALVELDFMVWSGTPKDSSTSYTLNPQDGMLEYSDINGELMAIYVDIKE